MVTFWKRAVDMFLYFDYLLFLLFTVLVWELFALVPGHCLLFTFILEATRKIK